MRAIIKALLKSLVEKKARTFLVLFSISISAALIFANESFSQTVRKKVYDADVRWSGTSDLSITTKESVIRSCKSAVRITHQVQCVDSQTIDHLREPVQEVI